MAPRPRRPLALLLLGGLLAGASVSTASSPSPRPADEPTTSLVDALAAADGTAPMTTGTRQAAPEDRYALAGGCYATRSLATGRYVARAGATFTAGGATGEAFHFQAFDLGKYLLFGTASDFLAADAPPLGAGAHPAGETAAGYLRGTGDETLDPVRDPVVGAVDTANDGLDDALDSATGSLRGDGVVAAAEPSAAAEWLVREAGAGAYTLHLAVDDRDEATPGPLDPAVAGTLVAAADGALRVAEGVVTDSSARFAFELTGGCATWPEAELNLTGDPATGATPYGETRGYLDAHLHMMAFEFLGGEARCGRPWHPYGIAHALVDCPDHEPGGRGAVLEQVLSKRTPGEAHDTVGWPTFGYWPRYDSLTHEQVYYRWLERAWRGGLRMFTNLLVDNGVLCEVYPYKRNSCNEMDGVLLQAQRLRELERYVDAQSGGPGEGWFRIVTDPFEARRVVNAGRLAVVMGIEVSVPFDCSARPGTPQCDVEGWLDRAYALGVRQMELTNKFDNALTGVTGDDGDTGLVVNTGNMYETGHYWKMRTCVEPDGHGEHDHRHDKLQHNVSDHSGGQIGRDAIFGAVLEVFGGTGAAPVYPAGPHCNAEGLSALGKAAIDGIARRGMIFDPDHMSALARKQALEHLDAIDYSGVVSSHSWADDPTYRAILELGGVVTPHAGGSASFVKKWRTLRQWAPEKYVFGLGFGSDVNGFSTQGAPRNPAAGAGVTYPFTGLGGVVLDRQRTGQQTWDLNTDGLDHYGLYPDWVEDGRVVAGAEGDEFVAAMERGVEAYLQMWERAIGIRPNACHTGGLSKDDLKRVDRGMTPEEVLAAVGQPDERVGTDWTYCSDKGPVAVSFDEAGRVSRHPSKA